VWLSLRVWLSLSWVWLSLRVWLSLSWVWLSSSTDDCLPVHGSDHHIGCAGLPPRRGGRAVGRTGIRS